MLELVIICILETRKAIVKVASAWVLEAIGHP